MLTFKKAAVSFLALGSLLVGAGAAVADGGTPSGHTARSGDGAQTLCKRVPKIEKRIERALERINGDADERGSLARLEQRVAAAEDAGHTEVHTFLKNRLTARTTLKTTLGQRQKDVAAVKTWCQAQENGSDD
ncbi:hypothetical protein QMZ92_09660 [Streptomyces sp. HNM0645]|uniref:hypothetical protein n=1 Tax=Streptomyces sp. HNM0645 TaxID=2782343 RepID=UPI0024B79459|nr:hypothetical protein [Streptomyces sp. HNM0645]MDI9884654.1 hypothetical protein [Streptomyces sp. HNM0645]